MLWPLIAGLALFAIIACAVRGPRLLQVLGVAALLGVAGWFFHGTSAEGLPGEPIGFYSSLRHLAPALAVGQRLRLQMSALRAVANRLQAT